MSLLLSTSASALNLKHLNRNIVDIYDKELNLLLIVDGGCGEWSIWSECSRDCYEGSRKRTRRCDHPLPSKYGYPCLGETTETSTCNVEACTGKKDFYASRFDQCLISFGHKTFDNTSKRRYDVNLSP